MPRVLIVDDDDTLRETLARAVRTWGFETSAVNSAEGAIDVVRRESIDVMVTDLRLGGRDGIDLIRTVADSSPKTQTILMSAHATPREQQLATSYGSVRVLCKPFKPTDLQAALGEAFDSQKGYRGTVHGLSLVDMLQMFHLARRSVTLVISEPVPGKIHFLEGDLIHAECGELVGRDAIKVLLRSDSGSIATTAIADVTRTIEVPLEGLLIDVVRELDEGACAPVDAEVVDLDLNRGFAEAPSVSGFADSGGTVASAPSAEGGTAQAARTGRIAAACRAIVHDVEGDAACAVVEYGTGKLLGIFDEGFGCGAAGEPIVASCVDVFRSPHVARLQQLARASGAEPDGDIPVVDEARITCAHNHHFMKAVADTAVVVLVTTKSTHVGKGWASLRAQLPTIEALLSTRLAAG